MFYSVILHQLKNKDKMIEFKKQLITPTIAKQLLEQNTINRNVKKPVVELYSRQMANGEWREDTGEVIKISKTNRILDGQHRLLAIVKSNTAINLHIAYNVDDTVFSVLDTGSKRNSTDTFKVANIKQGNTIPSIITMYNLLSNNQKRGARINNVSTNSELLDQYNEDPIFWQNIAKESHNMYLTFAKIIHPSYIGGFYAFLSKLDSEKATQFMHQLTTGINITNQSVTLLRTKLMQDKMSLRKMNHTLKVALTIKTWNFFIKGIQVQILKFDPIKEEYPTAIK